jgi:hypothetical protein
VKRRAVHIAGAAFCQNDQLQCNVVPYTDFKNSSENLTNLTTPNLYITSVIRVWERSSNSGWNFVGTIFSKACYSILIHHMLARFHACHILVRWMTEPSSVLQVLVLIPQSTSYGLCWLGDADSATAVAPCSPLLTSSSELNKIKMKK